MCTKLTGAKLNFRFVQVSIGLVSMPCFTEWVCMHASANMLRQGRLGLASLQLNGYDQHVVRMHHARERGESAATQAEDTQPSHKRADVDALEV